MVKKRVLVVDDDPRITELLADMLTTDGYQVETVPNGQIALNKLRAQPYALILSDIKMPTADGLALYRAVEHRDPSLCPPFIFMTGYSLSPETQAWLEQTRGAILLKPFSWEEVRLVVELVAGAPAQSRTGHDRQPIRPNANVQGQPSASAPRAPLLGGQV